MRVRFVIMLSIFIVAGAAILLRHVIKIDESFSIIAAISSSISGWLAIRNKSEEPRLTTRDMPLVVSFRVLLSTDSKIAIALLQLAVIAQATASIVAAHSSGAAVG
jgi:uncharacterized membrane protein YfhO